MKNTKKKKCNKIFKMIMQKNPWENTHMKNDKKSMYKISNRNDFVNVAKKTILFI